MKLAYSVSIRILVDRTDSFVVILVAFYLGSTR